MARPTQVHIDIIALQHNFNQVRNAAPDSAIIAMVKANAYGHGLVKIAQALPQADAFGVTSLEEALILREANIQQSIIMMEGFFDAAELMLIHQHRLAIVVHQFEQIEALEHFTAVKPIKVWLKVNTGMHRLGFAPEALKRAYQRLTACAAVAADIDLLSHFATADEMHDSHAQGQLDKFITLLDPYPGQRSLANSAGILGWRASHFNWVRAGLMLYGISPVANKVAADFNLQPVMTLSSAIMAIKELQPGDKVGYGATWTAPEAMRMGIIAIGYGDGYPWHAKIGTPILVKQKILPLIGRVSMDMIMVDLREFPTAKIGDQVILWGKGLPIEQIAASASTIPYELVCKISERVKRL